LCFPSALPNSAECFKIRPNSFPSTDYLEDLIKSFLNLTLKVTGRKKENGNRNKTEKSLKEIGRKEKV
jgi:hypothetical protein